MAPGSARRPPGELRDCQRCHRRQRSRRLEYPIWLRVRGAWDDWPQGEEMDGFRVDIGPVLERKRRAVMAHASQATPLIGDVAESFCLTGDVLARLVRRHEVFLEPA